MQSVCTCSVSTALSPLVRGDYLGNFRQTTAKFHWNLTQNHHFWDHFPQAPERITDDLTTWMDRLKPYWSHSSLCWQITAHLAYMHTELIGRTPAHIGICCLKTNSPWSYSTQFHGIIPTAGSQIFIQTDTGESQHLFILDILIMMGLYLNSINPSKYWPMRNYVRIIYTIELSPMWYISGEENSFTFVL